MVVKIYAFLWALLLAATTFLLLTGSFNSFAAVVLGFMGFGLGFMGIIGVMPLAFAPHHPRSKH